MVGRRSVSQDPTAFPRTQECKPRNSLVGLAGGEGRAPGMGRCAASGRACASQRRARCTLRAALLLRARQRRGE